MGALPPPPHWLPRDDFLLKNAAEAGASFESLARGAVQFSRRFTVQELQERWISLLYDPVISEEASAKMLEFECLCAFSSKLNDSSFDNDNKDFKSVCGKRQTKSVKRYYYSMRKRIRNEAFLSSIDVDFLTGSSGNNNNNNKNDIGDDCNPPPLPPDSSLFGDSLTDQFGFIDNSVFPNNEHNIPENISGTEFEVPLLNSPFGYSPSSEMPPDWNDFTLPVDDDIIIQSEPPKMEDQMGISTPSTDDLLAQIDSILNSTSDDDMFPIDNIENESYLDTYGSLLLDSPNSCGETEKEVNAILPNEPSVQKAPLHYYGGDQVLLSSALSVNPACPELRNGVICCTLNTEDPDIPSNDDVFLPIRIPSTPLPSAVLCKYDEAYHPPFKSEPDVQMNNRWSFMKMREKSNMGVPSSNTAGGVVTRNTSSNEGLKEITSPRIATTTAVATRTTICALPAVATTKKTLVGCSMNTPQKQELFSHDPIANTSMLDQEDLYDGDSDGDLHDDDSDGDIPNFSDVEALILDMDLSPDDRDIFNKKVAKYQHQQTKRTIMRLEQAADAHIQRLIASQKAFAVLYSRSSTHFIKKPEVLVGRGTADTEVDIDLSREFRGNKISRRQAIIKINMDGDFFLQNVSKHLIHVNGKEIMPRQSVHLTQSSLIEVRGMAFVFEMNRNQVKRLVDGMKHNQES